MSAAGALIAAADGAQRGLRALLHATGLAPLVDGQPAWPLPWRIAVETFAIDAGLARATAAALAALLLALAALAVGARWRGVRVVAWTSGAVLLLAAPWPPRGLLLAVAQPTSFHRSPAGFDAERLAHGLRLYAAHCQRCHGAGGAGDGPDAAALPVWPPTLAGGLPWKRVEGELYGRVRRGLADRAGRTTMPAYAGVLSPDDTWAVLDALKLLAAGEAARARVAWAWPLAAPSLQVRCDGHAPRPLAAWRGQRLRVVVAGDTLPRPIEDPRFVTVALAADERAARATGAQCVAVSPPGAFAYAVLAGLPAAEAAAGLQFLVDRGGWLRAIGRPGAASWSEEDLLCRADAPAGRPPDAGLDGLLARIDAEPVQEARLALPHPR